MPKRLTDVEQAKRELEREKKNLEKELEASRKKVLSEQKKLEAEKKKKKGKVVVRQPISVGKNNKKKPTKTRRSVVQHKTAKKVDVLPQVLASIEETIQELNRMLAESEDSKHRGVGGMTKLTTKQQAIIRQLEQAEKRYDGILKLIEKKLS